ncbi:MAG: hypothetical protein AAB267_09135 [Candidatus Desantisbacteria bacterium]
MWFGARRDKKLIRFDPASQKFREFELPGKGVTEGLAVDKGGNIWFCDKYRKRVGRYSPKDSIFLEIDLAGRDGSPLDITTAAGNKIWFTMAGSNELGLIDGNNISNNGTPDLAIDIGEKEKNMLKQLSP